MGKKCGERVTWSFRLPKPKFYIDIRLVEQGRGDDDGGLGGRVVESKPNNVNGKGGTTENVESSVPKNFSYLFYYSKETNFEGHLRVQFGI